MIALAALGTPQFTIDQLIAAFIAGLLVAVVISLAMERREG